MAPDLFQQSPLLARAGFRHAFFSRRGGRTAPPFDSLHFGAAGQDTETSMANLRIAAGALAVDTSRLYVVTQVHGREIVVLHGDEDRNAVLDRRADAIVTRSADVACGVKIADCAPILLADRDSGAVAAVHAGWQGTVANVVRAAIDQLRRTTEHRGDLVAAIGPHIESCCFEVGDDVAARLQACAPEVTVLDRERGPRPYAALRAILRHQMRELGLDDSAIDDVPGCTRCDAARFFSFRRDRDSSGRQLAAIVGRARSGAGEPSHRIGHG